MTSTRKARKAQPANRDHSTDLPPADGGGAVVALSPPYGPLERAVAWERDLEEQFQLRKEAREAAELTAGEEAAKRRGRLRLVR
jgi:hypothetical protein